MSDKRFVAEQVDVVNEDETEVWDIVFDTENTYAFMVRDTDTASDLCGLLNEQQATIQRMKHSLNTIYKAFEEHYGYDMRNAVWLIDELSYDEIVDELYIAETDSKNRKEASMYWKKKVDEQQSTIRKLQDLCGESDGENAKLRIENEQLKNRLNKEYIKECSIR